MIMEFHQPGETLRDTGACDSRDHRTLELGIGVLVKIRACKARFAQRKGQGQRGGGKKCCLYYACGGGGVCRWRWRQ